MNRLAVHAQFSTYPCSTLKSHELYRDRQCPLLFDNKNKTILDRCRGRMKDIFKNIMMLFFSYWC